MHDAPTTIDDINYLLNIIRQRADPDTSLASPGATVLASFTAGKCFACGHLGHHAAECPNVTPEKHAVIEGLGKVWSWRVIPRIGGDFSNDGEASAKETEYWRFYSWL
jgi:hypothetical protein